MTERPRASCRKTKSSLSVRVPAGSVSPVSCAKATDCASSDVEQVDYANTLGIDIIITDHHNPPVERPRAFAMVNPWRKFLHVS